MRAYPFRKLLLALGLSACSPADPLPPPLREVASLPLPARQTRVAEVIDSLAARGEVPYLVGDTVYYLLRQEAQRVALAGDLNDWQPGRTPMLRLAGTDLWYRALVAEPDARLTYKYVVDGDTWMPDPHNPHLDEVGEYDNSRLQMPGYAPPPEVEFYPDIPHGRLDTLPVDTQVWPQCRHLLVYTPPGYDTATTRYPTVYFHDGLNQVRFAHLPHILDYSIHHRHLPPLVAVLIEPADRTHDYAFDGRFDFAAWVAQTLVPWIDARYRTRPEATQRATIGASFGGLISVLIAYGHPEVFGHCGSQSGAYWPHREEAVRYLLDRRDAPVTYAAIWGSYEGVDPYNRRVVEALAAAGRPAYWRVRPEGHTWGLWRATTAELLSYFFPPQP